MPATRTGRSRFRLVRTGYAPRARVCASQYAAIRLNAADMSASSRRLGVSFLKQNIGSGKARTVVRRCFAVVEPRVSSLEPIVSERGATQNPPYRGARSHRQEMAVRVNPNIWSH